MKHGGEAMRMHQAILKNETLSKAGQAQWAKERSAIATCDRCEFYAAGQCRKMAPRIGTIKGEPVTLWPKVAPGDWCGEFSEWYAF